jgi:hypothetical protein
MKPTKAQLIALLWRCKKWMADPKHRVLDWFRVWTDRHGKETERKAEVCRTCHVGAINLFATNRKVRDRANDVLASVRTHAFHGPWSTRESNALYDRAIKYVKEHGV